MNKHRQQTSKEMSSIQPPIVPPAQSTVTCDGCDTEFDVTWFCKICPASLCDTCKQRHESDRFLRRHTIVKRTGNVIRCLDVLKIIQPCPQHPEREITVYCKDCGVVCCIKCVEEKHERHAIITVERKYMEHEDELNELLSNIEKSTLTNLRSNIDELGEKHDLQQMEFEAVKLEVEKFRKDLKITVDKSCDNLLGEVEQKETEMRSEIESVIRKVENQIGANENFISECSARIREGGLGLIGYNPGSPPSHDQSILEMQKYQPQFVPGRDLMAMIEKNIGKIEMKLFQIDDTATTESVSVERRGRSDDTCTLPHKPITQHHAATNTAGMEDESYCPSGTSVNKGGKVMVSREKSSSVSAQVLGNFQTKISCDIIAVTGKDTAWIADWLSNAVYLYDESGRMMKSVNVKSGVWGVAVKASGDVVVCNSDQKIRLVIMSGNVSSLIDTSPFHPRGVCLTAREEIVVCMEDQGDKNHVAVYSPDGKSKVRVITVKDDEGRQILTDPLSVVMHGENFSVLNFIRYVVTFDRTGKVMWVYDGSQADRKGRFTPRGLCVDKITTDNVSITWTGRGY